MVSLVTWSALVSFLLLKLIDLTIGLRVTLHHELLGADIVEHGVGEVEYIKKLNILSWKGQIINLNNLNPEKLNQFSDQVFRKHSVVDGNLIRAAQMINLYDNTDTESNQNGTLQDSNTRGDNSDIRSLWHSAISRVITDSTKDKKQTFRSKLSDVVNKRSKTQSRNNTSDNQIETNGGIEVPEWCNNNGYISDETNRCTSSESAPVYRQRSTLNDVSSGVTNQRPTVNDVSSGVTNQRPTVNDISSGVTNDSTTSRELLNRPTLVTYI